MFIRQLRSAKSFRARTLWAASSTGLRPRCRLPPTAATLRSGARPFTTAPSAEQPLFEAPDDEGAKVIKKSDEDGRKDERRKEGEEGHGRRERKHVKYRNDFRDRGERNNKKGELYKQNEEKEDSIRTGISPGTEPENGSRSDGSGGELVPEKEDPDAAYLKKLEWKAHKQLQYTKEPFKIAEHVRATLDKGRYDEALLLTQKASRNLKVTVSWNHIIAYLFKEQRLHTAIKHFNEMKKRAQLPNARTYTVIFRGLAESQHPRLAVAEAIRIYNIVRHDGRVRLNIIHLNAVLDVCARAGDLDSMFRVLDEATDRRSASRLATASGSSSGGYYLTPDARTYTIVLNALHYRDGPAKREGLSEEQIQHGVETSIRRGRAVWEEIVRRWRKGQLLMDEPLVCAMGRVLLPGGRQDNEDILALLEQTMQLPRFDLGDKGATAVGKAADSKALLGAGGKKSARTDGEGGTKESGSIQSSTQNPIQASTQDIAQDSIREPAQDPASGSTQDSSQESISQDSSQESISQESPQDSIQETIEDSAPAPAEVESAQESDQAPIPQSTQDQVPLSDKDTAPELLQEQASIHEQSPVGDSTALPPSTEENAKAPEAPEVTHIPDTPAQDAPPTLTPASAENVENTEAASQQTLSTSPLPSDKSAAEPPVPAAPAPATPQPKQIFGVPTEKPRMGFAQPGPNTISLIMTALTNTRRTSLGPKYWDFLTKELGVTPDRDNYQRYLRVLRNGRASARAAALIQAMPRADLSVKAFRLALSACVSDNLNPRAYAHARQVFAVLVDAQRYADPLALRMFLQAATGNFHRFREQPNGQQGTAAEGKFGLGRQLLSAIDAMWAPWHVLASSLSFPAPLDRSPEPTRSPEDAWRRTAASRAEVVAVARRMVATLDKVVTEGMAESQDALFVARKRRGFLQTYIVRHFEKAGEMGRRAVAEEVRVRAVEREKEKREEGENGNYIENEREREREKRKGESLSESEGVGEELERWGREEEEKEGRWERRRGEEVR